MVCPNCGSLQANDSISCTVCGHEFSSSQITSIVPSAKRKMNKWENLLIIFFFLLFLNVLGPLAPYIITLFGKIVFFPIILIPIVTIFGIAKREKWAYYIIFGFCILNLLILLRGLLTSSEGFALLIPLMIIILPTLFFALKAYKEIKEFK